ncbi:MAG: amino acid permease, partial [Chlamydiota bacterium]|nr:amino acid permease [Chlamydiota bacterium]
MSRSRPINLFILSMFNVAAICSIRNWPATAEYGLASLFYFIIASLAFFIPVSLVSAELSTGWPEEGGVYVWIREALGDRWAFMGAWLLWIENLVWYPTVLSFLSTTIAYIVMPDMARSPLFIVVTSLALFWITTWVMSFGMRLSGWVNALGATLGTLLPGVIIIGFGVVWLIQGQPHYVTYEWG